MLYTKDFKTIKEQIAILENRGLKFKSKICAERILRKYNYFDVINGFESILLKKGSVDKRYEDVYFEDFTDLYNFDMQLKKSTLAKVFDIESRLRTSIAHNFAEEYCKVPSDTMNYTNPMFYKAPSIGDTHLCNVFSSFDLFRKAQFLSNGQVKSKSFIDELKQDRKYIGEYNKPPFWVVVKALPLGTLYYIFVFLDDIVKEKVLHDFGLELTDAKVFEQALFVLKEVRNQCAHLELITRFRLKRPVNLNNLNDIAVCANLSKGRLNYLDVLKIMCLFVDIQDIKLDIFMFYCKMLVKMRKQIADKALAKMGRKNISVWMKL